jgi:transposase-like protein
MAEKRQTSPAEWQQEAVRLVTEQHGGVAETARNVGMHVHRLRRWQQASTATTPAAFPGPGRLPPDQEALRQLRDVVQRLRRARDMFPQAMRGFVHASSGGMPVWLSTQTRGRLRGAVRVWRCGAVGGIPPCTARRPA